MIPMFKVTDIGTKLDERPFIPFRIMTSSGKSYDITHPELLCINARYTAHTTPAPDPHHPSP